MNIFEISSALITISAGLMYINFRFLKLPMTIGLMLLSLIFSFFILLLGFSFPGVEDFAYSIVSNTMNNNIADASAVKYHFISVNIMRWQGRAVI